MKVSRTSRLNGEYQKEISEIIRMQKDKMPEVKGLVSITEVDVAPDLKTAIVYVSIYGKGEEESKRSLENITLYIIRENAPVERATQGELTTWAVKSIGPFHYAYYYGEG